MKKQMEAMRAFSRTQMETLGFEVPQFDVETPRSSMGQVGTCNNGIHNDVVDEDVDEENELLDGFQHDYKVISRCKFPRSTIHLCNVKDHLLLLLLVDICSDFCSS